MSDQFGGSDSSREALSALADGEAHSHEVARACAAWKDQGDARSTWHAYQLIGDVMRSEDLAKAEDGGAFLKQFRERLAQEPVVLAPAASQSVAAEIKVVAPKLHRRAWAGPVAVAAGFVMVVGALLSSQGGVGGSAAPGGNLALSTQGVNGLAPASGGNGGFVSVADAVRAEGLGDGPSFSQPATSEAVLIRDPQLDRLLASQRAGNAAEVSFAGQGDFKRQVVFAPR